jgi:hypothetical protein
MTGKDILEFRILAVVQGEWGERIVRHITKHAPSGWVVEQVKLPKNMPQIIDEPDEFLPASLPQAGLVLALGESPPAGQLIGAVVKKTGAKAVICPVDNNAWVPPGMVNQLKRELGAMGVAAAFPKPFCSLSGSGDPVIDEFARHFGKPALRIRCGNTLEEITVIRGAPCGSTHHMASACTGVRMDESREKCALTAHHYPCLASMDIDPELSDTIMHKSGFLVMDEVERAVIECLGRNPWRGSQISPKEKSA